MLTWMLVNVCLSLLALAFITLNSTAPHRLRFYAGFAALVAWLVPWTLVPELPVSFDFAWELARMERVVDAGSARLTGVYPIIVQTTGVPLARDFMIFTVLELVFIALSLTGGALFLWNLVSHHYRLRRLAQGSRDGNWLWQRAGMSAACPVVVQREIAGAFSSGLMHPRIWIHSDLVASEQLPTLLRHELTHIRQHDNWYLLVITLVERLFWWNPLAWYLGHQTRELQELSCDEQCQRSISDYSARLAQLMLDSAQRGNKPRMLALSANILNNPNPNIKRIKLLQRSYAMKPRHLVSAIATATTAILGIGIVTAQPETAQAVAGERVVVRRIDEVAVSGGATRIFTQVVPADVDGNPIMDTDTVFFTDGGNGLVTPGSVAAVGPGDRFLSINSVGDDMQISLRFIDTPLPTILAPIANVLNGGFALRPTADVGNFDLALVVRAVENNYEWPAAELRKIDITDETAIARIRAGSMGGAVTLPMSESLVLEFPEAAERIVSVSATNLSVDDALALIAEEAGCNIFRDGDSIVVDWCDAR